MSILKGFWSYVQDDDQAEVSRISRLAKDVVLQFEMLTGEQIDLFLDKDGIQWGDDWKAQVDTNLALTAFFIPVLTPRYFMSAECRRELHFFASRATGLGFKELVLPLLYVDVPSLHDPDSADDLLGLVRTYQWEDWTDLRFASPDSEEYRRGVARLATRLVEANAAAEQDAVGISVGESSEPSDGGDLEEPGMLDRLADGEEALPQWHATLEAMTADIVLIGQLMEKATEDMESGDSHGKGFALRLTIAHRLSGELAAPTERIESSANEFVSQLHRIDDMVRALIDFASSESANDPENKRQLCSFFDSLRALSSAAHEGLSNTKGMIDAIGPIEAMSRDLRAPLRRLRQGLTIMAEARQISDEWVALIDRTGLTCDDDTSPGA